MGFLRLIASGLLRHRVRNILTLVGIGTSVVALYAILSFNKGFMAGLNEELGKTGVHFMVVPAGCPHEVASLVLHGAVIPTYLDKDIAGKVREIAGEGATLAPMLVFQRPNRTRDRVDLLHGTDFSTITRMKPSWKLDGRYPSRPDEIVVGYEIAAKDHLKAGDTYVLSADERFIVSGVLGKTSSKDDAFVFLPIETARRLLGDETALTAVGVRLADATALESTVSTLTKRLPGIQIVTIGQVLSSISALAASARVLGLSVAAIAVIVSLVGVMNTILMTVFERTQELGMMRAVGATASQLFGLVAGESLLLSASGAVAGITAAVVSARLIERFVRGFLPYVPQGTMITFDPQLAATCILFIVAAGALSGLYPAWRASRISPIEAIRS